MKIYFDQSKSGKDTSELDSGYLVWILEYYKECDFNLRKACEEELSDRLSLDFTPRHPMDADIIRDLKKEVADLKAEKDHFQDLIVMAIICKGNHLRVEQYANNPEMMAEDFKLIREITESND